MAEETKKEDKVELTFDQRLAAQGYPIYYQVAKMEELGVLDNKWVVIGYSDAVGKKAPAIVIPIEEAMRGYAALAKKVAAKV